VTDDRQVILLSGGSRGLGGAIVRDLLARGHAVSTFSRKATPLVDELLAGDPAGESFTWRAIDATDHAAVQRFALDVHRRHGRLDALINNAALGVDGVLALMREEEIARGLAVNLEGAIRLTRVCARLMLARRQGVILNVSSVNGLRGHSGVSVYSATKAALDGFTRSLARELGPRGIRINSLAPGFFDSDMASGFGAEQRARIVRRTPLGRLGTVDDLVGVVRFLLSAEARFITGQVLVVDGGLSC
jgi:3-oxoacyl-[acyl-carrier protein] reductase